MTPAGGDVRLPDPQASRAVLIGTSRYHSADLPDLPAVESNLRDLATVLTDPALCGLPQTNCVLLSDPPNQRAAHRALRESAAEAEDLLLVYIACHGLTGPCNELYLAVADTALEDLEVSALAYDRVRQVVLDSPADNRVVILDCCFSGRAIADMAGDAQVVLGQIAVEGSYVLTATPANSVAMAERADSPHTAFTGELLDLIRAGVPGSPELLTCAELYRQLTHRARMRRLPKPCQRGTGTVDQLALTRNAAHGLAPAVPAKAAPSRPAPAEPAPVTDGRQPGAGRSVLTRRAVIGTAGAAVTATVAGTGWYLRRTGSPRPDPNRLVRTLRGHVGAVSAVAFHPRGTLLATAGYDGTARLWSLATGAHILTVEDRTGPVHAVVFSPDGASFATPGHLWNSQNGQQPMLLRPASESTPYAVAYSPDGKTLVTGYADSTVAVSAVDDGRLVTTIRNAHPSGVTSLAFSPDGRTLATATGGAPVRLWDVGTGRNVTNLADGAGPVAYAPRGASIATQGRDESTIRLWDATSGRNTAMFNGHPGLVRALSYHPDGNVLASAHDDHTVRRWHIADGSSTVLTGHTAAVLGVAFDPTRALLASASEDATVRIWNADP